MAEPEISVVIPAWNEEAYVARALASVRDQLPGPASLEAIVVDNGSTDRTSELARAFAATCPEVAIRIVREPWRARARAKNVGAAVAHGRVLVVLDADSRMGPGLAAAIVGRVRRGERAASIRVLADETSDLLDRGFFGLIERGKALFGIRAQMSFCERALFDALGGFPELQIGEDRELLVRAARSGVAVGHVDEAHIATSPRRLHALPLHLGVVTMFGRWALAHAGIGRDWRY